MEGKSFSEGITPDDLIAVYCEYWDPLLKQMRLNHGYSEVGEVLERDLKRGPISLEIKLVRDLVAAVIGDLDKEPFPILDVNDDNRDLHVGVAQKFLRRYLNFRFQESFKQYVPRKSKVDLSAQFDGGFESTSFCAKELLTKTEAKFSELDSRINKSMVSAELRLLIATRLKGFLDRHNPLNAMLPALRSFSRMPKGHKVRQLSERITNIENWNRFEGMIVDLEYVVEKADDRVHPFMLAAVTYIMLDLEKEFAQINDDLNYLKL